MTKHTSLADIYDFLTAHTTAVLATCTGGEPYAVTIQYVIDRQFNCYFATRADTRKHKNLLQNPRVCIVVHDERYFPTSVQLFGPARTVSGANRALAVQKRLLKRVWKEPPFLPPVYRYGKGSDLVFFKFTVRRVQWFRSLPFPKFVEIRGLNVSRRRRKKK